MASLGRHCAGSRRAGSALRIAADGGIEGPDLAERLARTLMAMLLLAPRDRDGGTMLRLTTFVALSKDELTDPGQRHLCQQVLSAVAAGVAPEPDDMAEIAMIEAATWEAVARVMRNCAAKVML